MDFSRFARFNDTALPNWATFFIRVINWECHKVEYSNFAKCLSLQYRSSSSKDTGLLLYAQQPQLTSEPRVTAARKNNLSNPLKNTMHRLLMMVMQAFPENFLKCSWTRNKFSLHWGKCMFHKWVWRHEGRWMAASFCKYGV